MIFLSDSHNLVSILLRLASSVVETSLMVLSTGEHQCSVRAGLCLLSVVLYYGVLSLFGRVCDCMWQPMLHLSRGGDHDDDEVKE